MGRGDGARGRGRIGEFIAESEDDAKKDEKLDEMKRQGTRNCVIGRITRLDNIKSNVATL